MQTQRQEVSYALQRRATLEALCRPNRAMMESDPCDADPLLIRSALHHGNPAGRDCPVCAGEHLQILLYVFGDQLGQYSGRIKQPAELDEMENEFGEFKVCEVEVCPDCGWNFMIATYLLGDGRKRRPPRRKQTVEDIYG